MLYGKLKDIELGHKFHENNLTFEDVYETEDDSLVFAAGGENQIDIEFFNFNHALMRTFQIMYKENGKYNILYSEDIA